VQQAGGTVARAKRTDRAEARRRYRATIIDSDQSLDSELDSDEPEATEARAPRAPRARSAAPAGPPPRPSIVAAFRGSFRPLDLRGDLEAIPTLLRHRAFLVPVLLVIAAAGVLIATGGSDVVSRTISPYFLAPPPVGPVFLAGFLAPRASWILGILIGAVASVALAVALVTPAVQASVQPTAGGAITPVTVLAVSLIVSTLGGAAFASAAAWYKRFLASASPSRTNNRPGSRPGGQRRKGPDSRPLLARRR
jgi:hypothetical protein